MTKREKEMAEELWEMVNRGYIFSTWEVGFIWNMKRKPYHDHLSYRQQEILEEMYKNRVSRSKPVSYQSNASDFARSDTPVFSLDVVTKARIKALEDQIEDLVQSVDRLSNGQSALFREAEKFDRLHEVHETNITTMAEFFDELNERVIQTELALEEFE